MEEYHEMFYFWRMVISYLMLLGVQFILLGVALAGWLTATKRHEQQMS
jgi:hypothetical protein